MKKQQNRNEKGVYKAQEIRIKKGGKRGGELADGKEL